MTALDDRKAFAPSVLTEIPLPGPGAISLRYVRQAIDDAEPHFAWCWEVVTMIKAARAEPDTGERVLRFQGRLLEGVRPLEAGYLAVKREEKRLIRDKARYKPAWFRRRMSKLSFYGKTLLDAIAIGRALGDGFAWFFYERDRALVRQHLQQPSQPLLPTGIGGLGERIVATGMSGLDGRLLIYHGLTSFLRMGDVSLIDLKACRVDAIGELKTQKVGHGRYNLLLSFLADTREKLPRPESHIQLGSEPPPPLDPEVANKLDRQMQTISKAMSRARQSQPERQFGHDGQFYFEALTELVNRSHGRHFEFARVGPGLIVGALKRSKDASLSSGLLDLHGTPERLVRRAERAVRDFLLPEPAGNAVFVGGLGAGRENLPLSDQGLPFAWWGAPDTILREILFGETLIVTLYNPAHLYDALRGKGFALKFSNTGEFEAAVLRENERSVELRTLDRFHSLIGRNLVSQESVLTMIEESLSAIRSLEFEGPIQMTLDPLVARKPPPTESR